LGGVSHYVPKTRLKSRLSISDQILSIDFKKS
jgi:hypothetical protein